MEKKYKILLYIICLVVSIIIFCFNFILTLAYRFKNPNLTNTQLLLNLWGYYLIIIICSILIYAFYCLIEKNKYE